MFPISWHILLELVGLKIMGLYNFTWGIRKLKLKGCVGFNGRELETHFFLYHRVVDLCQCIKQFYKLSYEILVFHTFL